MRKKKEKHGTPNYSKKYGNFVNNKSKSVHSIMHRHEKRIEEFKNKEGRLKVVNDKINGLKREFNKLSKDKSYKILNDENVSDINLKLHNITYEMKKLEGEYKTIESGEDEIEYLLESSNIMLEYVILEQQESVLLEKEEQESDELNDIINKKNRLIDEYMIKFENKCCSQKTLSEKLYCPRCNVLYDTDEGYLVCSSCGLCDNAVIQAEDLSFKEMRDYEYRPQFTYDKMTHLDDWLRRFQSKENRVIPQEVLDKVILQAKKEKIVNLNLLTEDKVKRYLKRLNLNEYYDNVIGIINRINGRPPFKLTAEIETKIKIMFQQIQKPYEKYKPQGRKNFLSYSYCIHKLFQILGLHEFSKYFPLLKSVDKLRQQDDIFKKIVAEMSEQDKSVKWVFYPSV
jgi:hypothetical protein